MKIPNLFLAILDSDHLPLPPSENPVKCSGPWTPVSEKHVHFIEEMFLTKTPDVKQKLSISIEPNYITALKQISLY